VFVGSTSPFTFGATSAVAPLWAGLTALLVGALGHAVGDLNAKLYPLIGTTALRDITSGTNGGFQAKAGWDGVTGCGTPVGQELLAKLGQSQQPVSDPVGTWDVNANGSPGVLSIPSIDAQGTSARTARSTASASSASGARMLRCSRSCGSSPRATQAPSRSTLDI
jgi:kumamolisin